MTPKKSQTFRQDRATGHLHACRTLLADIVLRLGQQRTAQSLGLTQAVIAVGLTVVQT
jgi:hypothetical protein